MVSSMKWAEQFSLRWENVDFERGIITLPKTKMGDVQYVHLNEETRLIVRGMNSWQRSVWVFPSENLRTPLDPKNFYKRVWLPVVERTGIERATWHSLWHTLRITVGHERCD